MFNRCCPTNGLANHGPNGVFVPSTQLGGDMFGYHWLDPDHAAIYLLDVSGHGVGSSLLAVSASNMLTYRSLPNTDFHDPGQVLTRLNELFQMDRQDDKYFTIWYGIYDRANAAIGIQQRRSSSRIALFGGRRRTDGIATARCQRTGCGNVRRYSV